MVLKTQHTPQPKHAFVVDADTLLAKSIMDHPVSDSTPVAGHLPYATQQLLAVLSTRSVPSRASRQFQDPA